MKLRNSKKSKRRNKCLKKLYQPLNNQQRRSLKRKKRNIFNPYQLLEQILKQVKNKYCLIRRFNKRTEKFNSKLKKSQFKVTMTKKIKIKMAMSKKDKR